MSQCFYINKRTTEGKPAVRLPSLFNGGQECFCHLAHVLLGRNTRPAVPGLHQVRHHDIGAIEDGAA